MKKKRVLALVFGGVFFVALMGWLYQLSSSEMCFPKLGFTFIGSLLFWMIGGDVIGKLTRPVENRKKWLKSLLLICVLLLAVNQILLYSFVSSAFNLAYECDSNTTFLQFIQINHLLPNFLIFFGIVWMHHYKNFRVWDKRLNSSYLFISTLKGKSKVEISDIICVMSDNNMIVISTVRCDFPLYERLKDWEAKLEPYGFLRVHRSALINPNCISDLLTKPSGDALLEMTDGRQIRVSRTYKKRLIQWLESANATQSYPG